MAIVGGPWCLGSVGGGTLCGLPGLCEPFLPMPQWSVPGKPIATWWGLPSHKKKLPRPGSPRRVGTCAAAAQHRAARMICRAEPGPSTTRQGPRPAARRRPVFLVRKSLPSSVAIIGAHQLTTVCRFPGLIDPDTQDDFFTRWCLLSNPGRVR
jgi:hypothetical protein